MRRCIVGVILVAVLQPARGIDRRHFLRRGGDEIATRGGGGSSPMALLFSAGDKLSVGDKEKAARAIKNYYLSVEKTAESGAKWAKNVAAGTQSVAGAVEEDSASGRAAKAMDETPKDWKKEGHEMADGVVKKLAQVGEAYESKDNRILAHGVKDAAEGLAGKEGVKWVESYDKFSDQLTRDLADSVGAGTKEGATFKGNVEVLSPLSVVASLFGFTNAAHGLLNARSNRVSMSEEIDKAFTEGMTSMSGTMRKTDIGSYNEDEFFQMDQLGATLKVLEKKCVADGLVKQFTMSAGYVYNSVGKVWASMSSNRTISEKEMKKIAPRECKLALAEEGSKGTPDVHDPASLVNEDNWLHIFRCKISQFLSVQEKMWDKSLCPGLSKRVKGIFDEMTQEILEWQQKTGKLWHFDSRPDPANVPAAPQPLATGAEDGESTSSSGGGASCPKTYPYWPFPCSKWKSPRTCYGVCHWDGKCCLDKDANLKFSPFAPTDYPPYAAKTRKRPSGVAAYASMGLYWPTVFEQFDLAQNIDKDRSFDWVKFERRLAVLSKLSAVMYERCMSPREGGDANPEAHHWYKYWHKRVTDLPRFYRGKNRTNHPNPLVKPELDANGMPRRLRKGDRVVATCAAWRKEGPPVCHPTPNKMYESSQCRAAPAGTLLQPASPDNPFKAEMKRRGAQFPVEGAGKSVPQEELPVETRSPCDFPRPGTVAEDQVEGSDDVVVEFDLKAGNDPKGRNSRRFFGKPMRAFGYQWSDNSAEGVDLEQQAPPAFIPSCLASDEELEAEEKKWRTGGDDALFQSVGPDQETRDMVKADMIKYFDAKKHPGGNTGGGYRDGNCMTRGSQSPGLEEFVPCGYKEAARFASVPRLGGEAPKYGEGVVRVFSRRTRATVKRGDVKVVNMHSEIAEYVGFAAAAPPEQTDFKKVFTSIDNWFKDCGGDGGTYKEAGCNLVRASYRAIGRQHKRFPWIAGSVAWLGGAIYRALDIKDMAATGGVSLVLAPLTFILDTLTALTNIATDQVQKLDVSMCMKMTKLLVDDSFHAVHADPDLKKYAGDVDALL